MNNLVGCATTEVDHAFSFDVSHESFGVRLLDYRYGDSRIHGTRVSPEEVADHRVIQNGNSFVHMRPGNELYVKWQIAKTGEVLEKTVELKGLLPSDITDCRIHFVIAGPKLYVYLVKPEKRDPKKDLFVPLPMYSDLVVVQLFPSE